jgi:omega-hydroxy-beta-dihydromenaquinone-9 sulfotransferase
MGSQGMQQLMMGTPALHWLRLLLENGGADRGYWGRAAMVAFTGLLTCPVRVVEHLLYARSVRQTAIRQDPIFIIGHWRSGTTWLHNLMSRDPSLGFVTGLQMAAPDAYLVGTPIMRAVLKLAKPVRPMDRIPMSPDSPEEDEFVMAKTSPHSAYHFWSFPKRTRHYFEKYALFRGISESELSEWRADYMRVLKKTTLSHGGRRLVLKNPINMGRTEQLLKLFPHAKFVHIFRDPRVVFASSRNLYTRALPMFQLQAITPQEVEDNVLMMYKDLMGAFLSDRHLIPPENLVEVRFEDLERKPLDELRRIYTCLGLPGYTDAEPKFQASINATANYEKNAYVIDQETAEKVQRHWGFALSALGYDGD